MATAEAEPSLDERGPPGGVVYDGFISYSHAADDLLAPRLQAGLQRFAKPWWKRRALRIFRDESSLSANPHLWSSITDALDRSAWFVLLLSPEAAGSPWVNNEVEYWLENKDPDRIIPVLTDGDFGWADEDFTSDAAPPALQGAFADEPRWVDLRFARSEEQLDLNNPRFSAAIADVASAIRGVPKDELESEEVRQHRRTVRTAWGAFAVVLVLAAAAVVFGVRADQQASLAQASRLATASVNVLDEDPELALLLAAVSANSGAELGFEQRRALHAAIDRHKTIHTIDHSQPTIWATYARLSPDASKLAVTGDARAPLEVYALSSAGSEFLWTANEIPAEWAIRTTFTADSKFVLAWAIWPVWDRSVPLVPDDPSVRGIYVYDADTGELTNRPQGPQCDGVAMYGIAHGDGPASSSRRASSQPSSVIPGWCMPFGQIPVESTAVFTNRWWLLDPTSGDVVEVHDDDRGVWRVTTTDDASLVQIDYVLGTEILDRNTGELYPIRLDYSIAPWATLSPGGRYLFFGDRLLDPRSGEELTILEGGRAGLDGCDFGGPVFSSDDSRLMFGCEDGSVRIFSSNTGEEIERLRGHAGWAVPGSFDTSGEFLASGSADGFVREWDISPRAEISSVHLGTGYYADSGVDLSGNEGAAIVYPTETETLFNDFFSTMTRHAVGELVLFDLASGEVTHRIEGVAGKVARISPDGTAVVAQTADERGLGDLAVFDLDTGAELYTLPGLCRWKPGESVSFSGDSPCEGLIPLADATDLAWSPDGRYIAMSAGASQRLLVWDTATRAFEFVAEPAPFFPFSAVAYSPDGSVLAVSSKTGMWIYDTATWDLITTTTHTGRPSWVMHFTSDGSSIITAQAHSGDVRIYDTATWEERNIRAGIAQTRDMAVSKDETLAALSSSDGSIHVLDLESGALLDLISLDNRDITNIEFIDGDTRLLISHATGPLEILTLDVDELVRVARSRISRSLTDGECSAYLIDPCPTLDELRNG